MNSPEIAPLAGPPAEPNLAQAAPRGARFKPLALRVLITAAALLLWFWTQSLLGARGGDGNAIGDGLHRLSAPVHDYLASSPRAANLLLVVSSLGIDALGVFLLGMWIIAGKLRPFAGL